MLCCFFPKHKLMIVKHDITQNSGELDLCYGLSNNIFQIGGYEIRRFACEKCFESGTNHLGGD